ncbi:MAG: hypothetical protein FWE91_01615 [Defluviitaleaceae bacterium]|nr:hypothetical protein [Defluviitaleaceae bacterium]MCL2835848.1 hypothetical protein [Defluviitaleaceae bacterium]
MKIKRYEGAAEQDVVRQIREELGPQAAIVSIKSVRARGFLGAFKKPRVEIMAAYEEPGEILDDKAVMPKPSEVKVEKIAPVNAPPAPKSTMEQQAMKDNRDFAAGLKDAYKDRVIEEQADKIRMLENSVASAQEMLTRLSGKLSATRYVAGKTDRRFKNNVIQVIYDSMLEQGVNEDVAAAVLEGLDIIPNPESGIDVGDIVKMVYAGIVKIIGKPDGAYNKGETKGAAAAVLDDLTLENPVAANPPAGNLPRTRRRKPPKPHKPFVAVFLGPTGVGKTTTIAKLSADFVLNKKTKISLISADTYRIAAVEQLRTYADILEIDLGVVYGPDDLANHLEAMGAEKEVILIDTAGRSHKHGENMSELAQLLDVAKDCHKYLVLSLTTKFEDMLEIARTYSQLTDFNIIFTKLDETGTLGSVLNLCYAVGKPVSYITFGQNVPDDIRVLQPEEIARAILSGTN